MTRSHPFLALLCCILISGQTLAWTRTTASGQKVTASPTTDASLARQFKKIKVGMTEKEVLANMGEPKHKEANNWMYALDRAPVPGEQLMIYQITFRDRKVVEKQILGGPDATGPAPGTAH